MAKHPILAPLLAATLVSGCATLPNIATACDVSLRAADTVQTLIPILERDWHLSPEKAASWASVIMKGADGVRLFCAFAS